MTSGTTSNYLGMVESAEPKYLFRQPGYMKEYHGCMINYPIWEILPDIESFQSLPGDVVIASFPKCGTTLTAAIVHMIQNDTDPGCLSTGPPLAQKIPYLEFVMPNTPAGSRIIDKVKVQKPPRTYFTHLSYHALPQTVRENAKIIYVTRNPKDTIVSMHNFVLATPGMGFKGTLEDTFDTFANNQCIYAPFYDHVAEFWTQHKTNPNIFFTSFEELLHDFKNVVKKLGLFLGKDLTEGQLDTLMYHCNFDQMKANEKTNRNDIAKMGLWDFSISPFMRAGKVGNWQQHFSPELNKLVDEWIASEEARLKPKLEGFKFVYV